VPGLRVLVVSDWYPDAAEDGAGSFVRQQALAVARDHEVTVLHLRGRRSGAGRPRLVETADGPLRTLRVAYANPPAPATAVNVLAVAVALRRLRRTGHGPQLVHAHEFTAGFAALVAGRRPRLPLIVSEHSSIVTLGELDRASEGIARRTFAAADLVCPVSEGQRRLLDAGGWLRRAEVVPNVVDTERFRPSGAAPPAGPARILVVAAFDPVKGIGDLVEAAGLLAATRSDFRIDVVGDGPLRGTLERRAEQLGLGSRLVFHGARPRDDVAARMQQASFAVVPSRYDTFSVVLSEAMACGLPVVATSVGGIPERVHAGNGLLCQAGDPAALAAAIARMIEGHRGYDRRAIAAAVRATLSADVLRARWGELYARVAGGGGRGPMS